MRKTAITRFGVSMEDTLLGRFDRHIEKKGYTNRSEAIRDIVRERLIEAGVRSENKTGIGVLTFVYDHHHRELERNLNDFQHDHFKQIISTTHVHVDHDNCLEVIILKGKANVLRKIADRLLSFKGVKHGKLVLTIAE
jgi:CopG family transcriptional regulator, nickel-responsive regulator